MTGHYGFAVPGQDWYNSVLQKRIIHFILPTVRCPTASPAIIPDVFSWIRMRDYGLVRKVMAWTGFIPRKVSFTIYYLFHRRNPALPDPGAAPLHRIRRVTSGWEPAWVFHGIIFLPDDSPITSMKTADPPFSFPIPYGRS